MYCLNNITYLDITLAYNNTAYNMNKSKANTTSMWKHDKFEVNDVEDQDVNME